MSVRPVPEYQDLIGVPFEWGGRDEKALDCWGLVRLMYARMGVDVGDYPSRNNIKYINRTMLTEREKWKPIMPEDGLYEVTGHKRACPDIQYGVQLSTCLMFRVDGFGAHVGFVVDPYRFIHAFEMTGTVVVSRISEWKNKIIGVYDYQTGDH